MHGAVSIVKKPLHTVPFLSWGALHVAIGMSSIQYSYKGADFKAQRKMFKYKPKELGFTFSKVKAQVFCLRSAAISLSFCTSFCFIVDLVLKEKRFNVT